jgi:hypothetical protein
VVPGLQPSQQVLFVVGQFNASHAQVCKAVGLCQFQDVRS